MSININDMRDTFIKFEALHIKCAKTIWINEETPPKDSTWTDEYVLDKFAYGIPSGTCLPPNLFEYNKRKTIFADRYGGYGIGTNGGAARSGIVDNFQIIRLPEPTEVSGIRTVDKVWSMLF